MTWFSMTRLFLLLWTFIVFVSTHDGYLVIAHRQSMYQFELNPMGQWLINLAHGDIWLLLLAKTVGTLCVSSIILYLYWSRPRLGWTCCAATALFQLALLLFLYLA